MSTAVKKVLFTSHVANFQKFNRPFMRWFSEQGYEVHYASDGEEKILDCDKEFTIPFERSPFSISNVRAIHQLKKVIDSEQYDIIHTHTPMGSVVTRIAAMSARKKGTRVIYTAHGFHFFKGAPIANWLIYYPIEKLMARFTDTLITINKEDYERAAKSFKTDVQYVPGVGIDPKKFETKMSKTEKTKLRKSLGLKDSDFVIIYVAELSKRKNQLWLVSSLAEFIYKHPDVHLILPGKDSLSGAVQRFVHELNLENNIHFLGYRTDIPELMRISNAAVAVSIQEGLPVNVMEAMSLGLPIIVTNCRGSRDLIVDNKTGLIIDINDNEGFVKKIKSLYSNETLRANLSAGAKKHSKYYLLNDVIVLMSGIYKPAKRSVIHLLASNQFSGAESVACCIIQQTKQEYNIAYCSPAGPIDNALAKYKIKKLSIDNFSYREIRRIVNEEKPDIIHAHDFKASVMASFYSKNIKVVSHIHQHPGWSNKINLRTILYRIVSKRFFSVAVVTEAMRGSVIFRSISKKRLYKVYNFLDKKKIIAQGEVRHNEVYDMVFCGRLEDVKQPLDFLEIVLAVRDSVPAVTAIMVGEGSLRKECESFIKKHDMRNNVTLVGFQNNPYKYMSHGKYLVITSKDEGFGLVAAEGAILGMVVASYPLAAIKELIVRGGIFGEKYHLANKLKTRLSKNQESRSIVNDNITDRVSWINNIRALYGEI